MSKIPTWLWVVGPIALYAALKWYTDPARQHANEVSAALAQGLPPPPPPGASVQSIIAYQQAYQQALQTAGH